MQTCVAGVEFNKVICSGATPFCQAGARTCSTTAEKCGEVSKETFKCNDKGFFPNIGDCSSYYQCAIKDGAVQRYQCPTGFNYNPEGKNCKRGATCFKIDCAVKANLNKFIIYRPDPSVYVFCVADKEGIPSAHVLKCKNEYSYVQPEEKCQFACLKEGRVADAVDATMFYDCYRSGSGYKFIHSPCLTGLIYSATEGFCIEKVEEKETKG